MKSFKEEMRQHLEVRGKGFTLIEVIVVLVIIAILIAIAVPNVLGYINKAKETEAQARVRNLYLACSAELALVLKDEEIVPGFGSSMMASTLNGTYKDEIAELAQIDPDSFSIDGNDTNNQKVAEVEPGKTGQVYMSNGVVAYAVYVYNDKWYLYNGYNGNITVTPDPPLLDFNPDNMIG